jgi:proteic killer suppression protein
MTVQPCWAHHAPASDSSPARTVRSIVARRATRYDGVIRSFRHKGLRHFYATGSVAGIQPSQSARLRVLLAALDTARVVADMNVPGFRLHPLKGSERTRWSVWVNASWRLTFEFRDGQAYGVDYEDYH